MRKLITLTSLLFLTGCATTETSIAKGDMVATWYMHGTRTANGERFDPNGMTTAHKTLPFGTKLRLTNGDRSVIVRVNDRGPFVKSRDLDLARGAAQALNCLGVCRLKVEEIKHEK